MFKEETEKKYHDLREKDKIKILAIESSCDETACAIVEDGRNCLSNIIATQIDIHKKFGGVVPEIASRNHILNISSVYAEALSTAGLSLDDIDAIAVTYGAGLVGALLVGVNYAKTLAYMTDKPLIAVNHIKGHIAANYISHKNLAPPFICLMISGGHTAILKVTDYNEHVMLGTTVDDAVGEAFDKVSRILGLGYPGGPAVDRAAKLGKADIVFSESSVKMRESDNFSFSGIKTSVINYVHKLQQKGEKIPVEDICASFQTAVVDELVRKTLRVMKREGETKLVVAGGVSANSFLKARLIDECEKNGYELFMPELKLCTDNAAMIASSAYFSLKKGTDLADLTLTAKPTISL